MELKLDASVGMILQGEPGDHEDSPALHPLEILQRFRLYAGLCLDLIANLRIEALLLLQ